MIRNLADVSVDPAGMEKVGSNPVALTVVVLPFVPVQVSVLAVAGRRDRLGRGAARRSGRSRSR